MRKRISLLVAAALLCAAGSATAAVTPSSSPSDSRIQFATYSPDNVFVVRTKVGASTLIQFGAGENVLNEDGAIGFGDRAAWNINTNDAGNSIFIKPLAESPDTNFQIITNKRTYFFALVTAKRDKDVAWGLRFKYPDEQKPGVSPFKGRVLAVNPCAGGNQNASYLKWGDNNLAPARVWDNGRFTCLKFPSSTDRPVVYVKLPDGTEALTNFHIVDDVMVIHETASEFRLRLGKQVMGMSTASIKPQSYNYDGTTTGERLETKNDNER